MKIEGVERLRPGVRAGCMVLTRRGDPCGNKASWAARFNLNLETLLCGTHLRYIFNHSGEFSGLADLEGGRGFRLKKVGDPAEDETIIAASGLADDEFWVSDKVALAEGGD